MDRKIELQVVNITNSGAQIGAYALLLGEVDGERQLPVIIGPAEAQSTVIHLKGIETPRPLTHDLFIETLNMLETKLLRVLIYEAKDGIFYSYIYLKKGEDIIHIDARTSDAVGLAVRAKCPILIYESILERECLHYSESDHEDEQEEFDENEDYQMKKQQEDDSDNTSSASLKEALEKAIKEENYELAAQIRDRIIANHQK